MLRRRFTNPRRWSCRAAVVCGLALVLGVATGCMNPSLPTDLLLNLPGTSVDEDLRADEPTLVVLQHGIWRSWGALWRLERALRAHGYEVLNESYPSTRANIESHAERLARKIEKRLASREGEEPRICFVGHSMGGLVIRKYLQREDARQPWACVFIATPHRGAILSELRRDGCLYQLLMGDKSARQLVPGDPFYDQLGPLACERIGVIYGGKGDEAGWSKVIPGDDDGTVGVAEAQLPGQTAAIRLRLGHTRLSFYAKPIHQTLVFLRRSRFED